MMSEVVIIGASGHGKVVADCVLKSGDFIRGFLDDYPSIGTLFVGFPILGSVDNYKKYTKDCKFIIAIGDSFVRERIVKKLDSVSWYTAIHPSAVISEIGVSIGDGSVVLANSVVNSNAKIGRHCIVNSGSIIEHDDFIGDFSHVSVGSCVAGTVNVGKHVWIGAGATVINNISICNDCMIGAGAVVVENINESGTYIGVPARLVKSFNLTRGGAKSKSPV